MIDITEPTENYTAGLYKKQANIVIKDILSRGRIPIIAGGTGFYIKALLQGLDIPEIKPDIEFRNTMNTLIKEKGKEYLHGILRQKDPVIADKLHPNDSVRIIRALEVINATGDKMSEVQAVKNPDYRTLYIGLNSENRDYLYERINNRVEIMHKIGLVEEVKGIINKYGKTLSLLNTLGYKEICNYLDGQISLDEALTEIKKNTRNFAKRQLTWFRANKEINWYYIDKMKIKDIIREIIKNYHDEV